MQLRRRYLEDQVSTATPAQRLLMLFDRLIADLRGAEEAFASSDLKEISDNLVHAQQVLFALRDPLDRSGELGRALHTVYSFCLDQLLRANLAKDRSLLPPVLEMIGRLAAANRHAAFASTEPAVAAHSG